jgi:hypothetical protein
LPPHGCDCFAQFSALRVPEKPVYDLLFDVKWLC